MNKDQVIAVLTEIATLLELKGENPSKVVRTQRAPARLKW
jgi:DNA polymerase/3'-5' exonuclease PolX